MSGIIVKSTFEGDVRRFQCSKDTTFEVLSSIIRDTYKIENFTLRYSDEEGDMITVDSDQELREAFRLNENSVLKLNVLGKAPTSMGMKEQNPDSVKTTEVPTSMGIKEQNANEQPESHSVKAETVNEQPPETKTPDTPQTPEVPSCAEIKQLILAFLSSVEVKKDLPDAIKAVLYQLLSSRDVDQVVQAFVGYSEAIEKHPSAKVLMLHLDRLRPKLAHVFENVPEETISLGLNLVDTVLPLILENLENISSCGQGEFPFTHFSSFLPGVNPFFQGCSSDFFSPTSSTTTDDRDTTSAPSDTRDAKDNSPEDAHVNIICDGCGVTPIKGMRFKCTVCPDFDLCGECESKQIHPADHALLKFRCPEGSCAKPEVVHVGVSCDGCGQAPIKGDRFKCSVCPDYDLCSSCETAQKHPDDHPMIKIRVPKQRGRFGPGHTPGGMFGGPPFRGRCGRGPSGFPGGFPAGRPFGPCGPFPYLMKAFMTGQTGQPSETTPPADKSTSQSDPKEEKETPSLAQFVKHVNFEEGHRVAPGQTIIKTWLVQNSGSNAWPAGTKLIFLRGDRELSLEEEFPLQVDLLEPTKTAEVSACLVAPEKPGRYTAYFGLADQDRTVFGPRLAVDVLVEATQESKDDKNQSKTDKNESKTDKDAYVILESKIETDKEEKTPDTHSTPPQALKESQVVEYAKQHTQLKELGFVDEELNTKLLQMHKGDVAAVCDYLFSH
jgi:hypothetical protein